MNKIKLISGRIVDGTVQIDMDSKELYALVMSGIVVIVKSLFEEPVLNDLRSSVFRWGANTELAEKDDFLGNYHMKKVKISNIQRAPHVFHDYNFNDFNKLKNPLLKSNLLEIFEPLSKFYNKLTNRDIPLGVIPNDHYFHPQLIQYPNGGGFFGRHNHNLDPQQIGFILNISKKGIDYYGGGTSFLIEGEVLDLSEIQDIGDLCLWRNDLDHWVNQTPLNDWFSWEKSNGRWVATLAYFNPF
jgi:hypothetical protein